MSRIGVVGAGSSGLLLALLLHRQGHQVWLFERSPQLRSEGCGILLVRSGLEAIEAAGLPSLLTGILQGGLPVSRFVIRNLRGEQIEVSPAQAEPGELPSLLIHRRAILDVMSRHLDPAVLHTGAECTGWSQDRDQVELQFKGGESWQGDLLVGADGIFSRVAPGLAPDRHINYLGDRVWRGVVKDASFCTDGEFFVYARGRGIYANFFDLGPDDKGIPRTHWGFFQEEPLPAERHLQLHLLEEEVPAAALAKLPADAAAVIAATPTEQMVANWSFDIDPLPSIVAGRVALIGDAAHAMSSSQARGMTAGLEDAVALAHHLGRGGRSDQEALLAYQSERLPVVHGYQSRSRQVSHRIGRKGPPRVLPSQEETLIEGGATPKSVT